MTNKGFTLIEILVAFAIIMAVTFLGMMGFVRIQQRSRVVSAADEIRALLRQAREKSLAQIDDMSYRVSGGSGVVVMKSETGVELERYQLPSSVEVAPTSWDWGFSPVTGVAGGCSGPCVLILTDGQVSLIVEVEEMGLVK